MVTILPEELASRPGTRFRAIADALQERIADGTLPVGAKLPTHRDLAWRVGVTVGTVTRAYAELERRGLVVGEVGRGTYVRGPKFRDFRHLPHKASAGQADFIDMTLNLPPATPTSVDVTRVLADLSRDGSMEALLGYQMPTGLAPHREAGAQWIARDGWAPAPDSVIVTAGAQHGILVALSAITRPGDRIAAEALTHPGLMTIAKMLGLRVDPIAMDLDGMIPEAVEDTLQAGARAIYCVPTLQNPTTAVLPSHRRQEIAEIVARHDAMLVEDDLFAPFCPAAPLPFAALIPDRAIYVSSLSKAVAPGLRTGYVVAPSRLVDPCANAVRTSCWMATPLTTEIATRWIQDGTAKKILDHFRRETSARLDIGRRILGGAGAVANDGALHLWLELPDEWAGHDFAGAAAKAGVGVADDEAFSVGRRSEPGAVRICLGPPQNHDTLIKGLEKLKSLLGAPPPPARAII